MYFLPRPTGTGVDLSDRPSKDQYPAFHLPVDDEYRQMATLFFLFLYFKRQFKYKRMGTREMMGKKMPRRLGVTSREEERDGRHGTNGRPGRG